MRDEERGREMRNKEDKEEGDDDGGWGSSV